MPRFDGHRHGVRPALTVVEAAQDAGVEWLTLYAFSTENWKRSRYEVVRLFRLMRRALAEHRDELLARGLRIRFLGMPDGLPRELVRSAEDLQRLSAANTGMTLTFALNHGGREAVVEAVRAMVADGVTARDVDAARLVAHMQYPDMPDLDLVIRTSGEQRISNFMLWQAAYAEFVFVPDLWPDFGAERFLAALETYASRERRFGAASAPAPGSTPVSREAA